MTKRSTDSRKGRGASAGGASPASSGSGSAGKARGRTKVIAGAGAGPGSANWAGFGSYVRRRRERQQGAAPGGEFSVRQLAGRIGVQPSYLSKVERGLEAPPSEEKIITLARELGEDPDVLLALAGKVSSDVQAIVRKRPQLFADLIRQLKNMPNHAVLRITREVRDGEW